MQKLLSEKECIYINKVIGKVLLISCLMILSSSLRIYGMCPSFRVPNSRVVIDGSYAGIHFNSVYDRLYVPARRVFEYLGANVLWSEKGYLSIKYEGYKHIPDFFIEDNRSYVSLDVVCKITGYYIEMLECINILKICRTLNNLTPDMLVRLIPSFYNYSEEDLMWMARIIHAEARGEPYEAMLAVGNVVLNRKALPQYPDTVRGVIFDRQHGVQFSPTANGAINNTPSAASFLAAVEVLEGRQNAEGVLFFKNPQIAHSSWMSRNRPFAFTLSNQDFFF